MEIESVSSLFGNTQIIAILGALLTTPLMAWSADKYGRSLTLTVILGSVGTLFLMAFFIPFSKCETSHANATPHLAILIQ